MIYASNFSELLKRKKSTQTGRKIRYYRQLKLFLQIFCLRVRCEPSFDVILNRAR